MMREALGEVVGKMIGESKLIANSILDFYQLGDTDFFCYKRLLRNSNSYGESSLSIKRVATRVCRSTKTVREALKKLERRGLISDTNHRTDSGCKIYQLSEVMHESEWRNVIKDADCLTPRQYWIIREGVNSGKRRKPRTNKSPQKAKREPESNDTEEIDVSLERVRQSVYGATTGRPERTTDPLYDANINKSSRARLPGVTYVYLISIGKNITKIGIASNPKSRIIEFRVGNPFIREYLHTVAIYDSYRVNARGVEKGLHQAFKNKRLQGEWFFLREEDFANIKVIFDEYAGETAVCHKK